MSSPPSKAIYISYADADRDTAVRLKNALKDLYLHDVWMRDFDLNGGELISESIHEAIEEAKWFLILLSSSSAKSRWLQLEANATTFRSIENLDFRIIVIKLDNTPLPKHLEIALGSQIIVDLSDHKADAEDFISIADYIDKTSTINPKNDVYVDRGESLDSFSLIARRNKVVFILGLGGIGKTSFIIESIPKWLKKRPLPVKLSRGHSLDLLSRQIIQRTYEPQPIASDEISDKQLLLIAIDALKKRADKFFLFLDNVEESLDGSNQPLRYLEQFLEEFQKSDVGTHLVLATTRVVEYSASIANITGLLRLEKLDDIYIKECIDQLIEGVRRHDEIMKMPEIDELVKLAAGHPLAARMLATSLQVKTPQQLLLETERRKFELNLAQYILKSTDQNILTDLHRLILQILATVREPMLLEDMLSVRELKSYKLDDIQQARWELVNLSILEQNGELMSIHNFFGTYFRDQLNHEDERLRDRISTYVGLHAHQKAMEFNSSLKFLTAEAEETKDRQDEIVQLTNSLFRYAVPAARLLKAVGKDDLAEQLPIQIKGTVREMVFYFYQEKRNYEKARVYAEQWLRLNPNDSEIQLQLARCYRNFRDSDNLEKAERILAELDSKSHGRYFTARLFREKALVAEQKGDIDLAKNLFLAGTRVDTAFPYIENYVGLSRILLSEAENYPFNSTRRIEIARRAVRLLEEARADAVAFDRYHIGDYAEALIIAGREDEALPLLREALRDRPKDERLNYRMGEILRKLENYDSAEQFAKSAHRYGHRKAPLSLANIYYGQAQRFLDDGNKILAADKLQEALNILNTFRPEYGDDQEVADTITAKIYRTMGKIGEAKSILDKYLDTALLHKKGYGAGEPATLDV